MTDHQPPIKPEKTAATPGAPTSVEHTAPDDQYAAGGQQQDQKKALKKSAQEQQSTPPAHQNAGLHSTGSFTGTTGGPGKKADK